MEPPHCEFERGRARALCTLNPALTNGQAATYLRWAVFAAALAAKNATIAAWAKDARAKLRRGCPAALLVADACARADLGEAPLERRAKALGMELVANQALAGRSDFREGVSCAVGAKKGEAPAWEHASLQAAAADPEMAALLEAVREAVPLGAGS